MFNVKSKIALVVGGGRGIGASITRKLAERGARVRIWDTDETASETNHYETRRIGGFSAACGLVEELKAAGSDALSLEIDAVRESQVVKAIGEQIQSEGISILVNALGSTHMAPITETTTDQFQAILDVNLTAPFRLCREVCRYWLPRKEAGVILNVSSISGKMGFPDVAAYCAAKAGVQALTSALSLEVANEEIRVNAICPGIVKTNMWSYLCKKLSDEDDDENELWAWINSLIPQGRPQTPEEVAHMALAIIQNEGMCGQSISVDGGMNRYG